MRASVSFFFFGVTFFTAGLTVHGAAFHIAQWQAEDGLPSNKVMAVLQTRDGYIWAGTFEGLVKFDGVRFTPVENARIDGRIDTSVTALHEGADGTLWIGHASGSISGYRGGKFTEWNVPESERGIRIQHMVSDDRGEVWSLNVAGALVRTRDSRILRPDSGNNRGVFDLVKTADGALWVNCRGRLTVLRDGALQPVNLPLTAEDAVQGLAPSADGGLWVVAGRRLWKYAANAWSEAYGGLVTGDSRIYTLRELSDGRLFAGTFEDGALLITPAPFAQERLWRESHFPSDWIFSVGEDHEGNIWVATGTAGLLRLRNERVQMLVPPDQWQGHSVLAVAATPGGEIWATTEGAGVYRLRDAAWTHFGKNEGLENLYAWAVCAQDDGRVLIGTWGHGLYELAGERLVRAPGMEHLDLAVAAMQPSIRGGALVGTQRGVLRYHDNEARWLERNPEHRLKDVRAILEEDDGTVWVACNGDGLGRIRGDEVRQYLRKDGLTSNYLRCLFRAPDGALWVGTRGGGLNRMKDGRVAAVTMAHGLVDNTITHLEADAQGHLWISTHAGIMRASLDELNACAEGRLPRINALSYGLNDGLLALVSAGPLQPAGCRLPSGELLFAQSRGLARIDPAKVSLNTRPPPVRIEAVRIGDGPMIEGPELLRRLEVAPGEHRIEIEYTALSFAAPEKVRFRRQLEGLEAALVEAGTERSAVYNFVPPGRYVFRVSAANNDGVWSDSGQTLEILVRPHFWQTAWFKAGAVAGLVAAVAGLAWYGSRRRLHRKIERLERIRAIEFERARIASEMHDDLGAHLTRITMLSDAARGETDHPERLKQGLMQIYETARNVTRAMDEIVWAVNPRHDTLESLVCYLEKFAQDFLGAAGIRVRLDLPLDYDEWSPRSDVRHAVFLCYKEALNNVVRHSNADTVTVALATDGSHCVLTVTDNGRGLPPDHARKDPSDPAQRFPAGNGLDNMRRRMAGVGGRCEWSNRPDGGCRVTLILPVNRPAVSAAQRM